MNLITVENIKKTYSEKVLLNNVSQIPEPRWASLLCIKLLTYYLSALIFLNGHASKRAPPTIFPMVTIAY